MKLPIFVGTGVITGPLFDHTKAISFNGTNETMANTTSQAIGVINTHSSQVWVKLSSTTAGFMFVLRNYNTDTNNIIQVSWNATKFVFWIYNSAGALIKQYTTVSTYLTGTKYQVGYTRDGTTLLCYVNGVAVSVDKGTDNTGTQTATNRKVWIGSNVGVNNFLNGIVSRADMWNSVLSASEWLSLNDSGNGYKLDTRLAKGNYTSTSNLKHQWALGKNILTNIGADYVSSGNINVSDNSVNISDADIVTF